jgi:hypothetical protein
VGRVRLKEIAAYPKTKPPTFVSRPGAKSLKLEAVSYFTFTLGSTDNPGLSS